MEWLEAQGEERWVVRSFGLGNFVTSTEAIKILTHADSHESHAFDVLLLFALPQTTLARRLFKELGGADEVCYLLHDYYYKDLSHLTLDERAKNNFDHPDSLETDLMIHHIQQLKLGHGCTIPTYDFTTHSRKPPEASIQMEPHKIILVEGILILAHPELRKELDVKVYVVCLIYYW